MVMYKHKKHKKSERKMMINTGEEGIRGNILREAVLRVWIGRPGGVYISQQWIWQVKQSELGGRRESFFFLVS